MAEFSIKYATIEDVETLSQLARKTFWETYYTSDKLEQKYIHEYMNSAFDLVQISEELTDEKIVYLLITAESQKPFGYAKLGIGNSRPEISADNPTEICRIYLEKEYWGKSLGVKLLDKCVTEAKSRSSDSVWLSVWEHNTKAIEFYKKQGFETIGEHVFDLAGSAQTDLLMLKEIRKPVLI